MHWPMAGPIAHKRLSLEIFSKEKIADYMREREREREREDTNEAKGCGTFDIAAASTTREPGFESSHLPLLLNNYLLPTVCRKVEDKEKEAENGTNF